MMKIHLYILNEEKDKYKIKNRKKKIEDRK